MILARPFDYYFKYPDCTIKLAIKLFYDFFNKNKTPKTKSQDVREIEEIIKQFDQGTYYDFDGILLSKKGFNLDLFFNVVYPHIEKVDYQLSAVRQFYTNLRKRWKSLMFYSSNPLFLANKKGIIAHGVTYFMDACRIDKDDVVVDLGGAPGDFGALAVCMGAKKVYCFDKKTDGLKETARLNDNKIEIIASYISSREENGVSTTLDQFAQSISPEKINFVKMDIEGAEIEALLGAKKLIANHKPKMAICVYHDYSHLQRIRKIIRSMTDDYKFETLGPVLYCTPGHLTESDV